MQTTSKMHPKSYYTMALQIMSKSHHSSVNQALEYWHTPLLFPGRDGTSRLVCAGRSFSRMNVITFTKNQSTDLLKTICLFVANKMQKCKCPAAIPSEASQSGILFDNRLFWNSPKRRSWRGIRDILGRLIPSHLSPHPVHVPLLQNLKINSL